MLQRRTGGRPRCVLRQKAIPGRACPAQMAHQVVWRLAALRALPYPGLPSPGKRVVVVGRQGLPSAPCLQLSIPHRYHCCTTRCNLLLVAHCHLDDTEPQPAGCPGMRGGLPQWAARPWGLLCVCLLCKQQPLAHLLQEAAHVPWALEAADSQYLPQDLSNHQRCRAVATRARQTL